MIHVNKTITKFYSHTDIYLEPISLIAHIIFNIFSDKSSETLYVKTVL